ncbi:amidase domain-containing protein [Paenibacillus apiarius]|uniref:Amidase domain-containing protein n=1 Tax=Paenibacillus apiarius TaxID=46240 RepID=A0ABT4DV69_9BACL|nr:amidase domain-containing protein [Paenibacillus apiarius]MCY9514886.1 amidase domain-containing protein [Paenibacillus apiarius]MCY9521234.1 amidase domain-containing protein [Paenibacillus apiarius]MCY9553951.1 amidase domain-containing protein [Paenibacillus apiarius]MCY9560324.1 amidase domain-containing protein [Paenibacillus apiarius]MCY9685674.1 amidase domain-containing protein [Paenibacillus apiarius]
MRKKMYSIILVICIFCMSMLTQAAAAPKEVDKELAAYIQQLFSDRAQFLIHRDKDSLDRHYVSSIATSRNAMRHETDRAEYVQAWAERRGIQFVDAISHVRIIRINKQKDKAYISTVESLKLDYTYIHSMMPVQSFGIGTRHALTLTKTDGKWHVLREWYLDPLEENPKLIPDSDGMILSSDRHIESSELGKESAGSNTTRKYNRDKAVAYANKYAGAAWGAGNKHRYHPNYRDYTGLGGDCTNFASQCIGDREEGGGLRMRGGWRHFQYVGGSRTWVQTDAFKDFLLSSGYGSLIARGSFQEIVTANERHPSGAIAKLRPGDLIAYMLRGDVDHFSIVVGFDMNGYPLVNSHTADRYRVPFDLGWDKHTTYLLIQIRD